MSLWTESFMGVARSGNYSARRKASDGMKKYSPPFMVTVCGTVGALALSVGRVPAHLTGQVIVGGRELCAMTRSTPAFCAAGGWSSPRFPEYFYRLCCPHGG